VKIIRRPNRRLSLGEKFLSLMSFIILFILWLTFLRPGPQEYQPPKQQEEKTYTVTLTERDISKIEKVIGHHLR